MQEVRGYLIFGSRIKIHRIKKIKNPEKVLEVLFEISTAVHNTRNLNELYRVIHKSLEKILNVDNFFIANHNKEDDSISFPYHVDKVDTDLPPRIYNFSKTGSLTGILIRTGKPLILFSKDLDKIMKENKQAGRPPIGIASKVWLGAPLAVKQRVIGAVVVQSYTSETKYKKSDLDILTLVSQHIAFAIEKKEADDKIEEQKKILEKIFELSPIGLALIGDRIFKQVNNKFVKLFGYRDKASLIGKSTEMIYPSKTDYIIAGRIISAGFYQKEMADFEYNLLKNDNTLFPAHITLNYAEKKGALSWIVASITDRTRMIKDRNEKMKHERLKGVLEMAGAICHELNQPLHAILGYCELIKSDYDTDEKEIKEIAAIIVEQIDRIKKITRKLLSITQYKTLKYVENNKIFDIWNKDAE